MTVEDVDYGRFADLFSRVPEDGVVVSPEGDGFHARIYVNPPTSYGAIALRLGIWVLVAAGAAWFAGDSSALRRLLFGCILIFGLLVSGFQAGRAFIPTELAASGGHLYFDGERFPKTAFSRVAHEGRRLVVFGHDEREMAEIVGVGPTVGAWVVEAVQHWKESE